MDYCGIIISGTSGSGKTTISRNLVISNPEYEIVKAITTRDRREDDHDQYSYMSEIEFKKLKSSGRLLTSTKYQGGLYGITVDSFQSVCSEKIPVLLVSPDSIIKAKEYFADRDLRFFCVFVDAPDHELDKRLRNRNRNEQLEEQNQRKSDRNHIPEFDFFLCSMEDIEISSIVSYLHEVYGNLNSGGVIPSQIIKKLIKFSQLIAPYKDDCIQSASYDLTLGDSYLKGDDGCIKNLDHNNPNLVLQAGDSAIVESLEIVRLPSFIAGRFDLRVKYFFQGVVLSNGPQVDPGYHGRLFCLLMNTSTKPIEFRKGHHFATIEFTQLAEPSENPYNGRYQGKDKMKDFIQTIMLPSMMKELGERVHKLEQIKWWAQWGAPTAAFLVAIASVAYQILNK